MKKIILVFAFIVSVFTLKAQKNSVFAAGNFSYERESRANGNRSGSLSFEPVIAYGLSDNWFLGIRSKINFADQNPALNISTNEGSSVRIDEFNNRYGGFIRYKTKFNDRFSIWGDLGGGYVENRTDVKPFSDPFSQYITNQKVRQYGFYASLVPTLFINFGEEFGLNLSFGGVEYSDLSTVKADDVSNKTKLKEIDLTFGKTINVGISKTFAL